MNSVSAKNRALLICAALWLFSFVAGDLLHSATHDLFDGKSEAHTCLICQFGHTPAQANSPASASVITVPEYSEAIVTPCGDEFPRAQTSPQPLIPRGPPA